MLGKGWHIQHLLIYSHHLTSVETRRELSMSLCNQHNRVNEKLGKPAFRCEMVRAWHDWASE